MKSRTENISDSTSNGLPPNGEIIAWCSIYAFESVLIFAGNLPTIVLFVMNRGLRKKSFFLIINMAFADLMYGAVFMPLKIYLMSVGDYYQLWMGRQSSAFNVFYNILSFFSLQGSLMSAALISCERFYAICCPLKHRILSMRAYHILIVMTWTLTFLVSLVCTVLLHFTSSKVALTVVKSCFFTLLSIVCGCNIGIWRTFRRRRIASERPISRDCLQNRRLTKTLLFVSVVALVSWLPVLIVSNLVISYEMSISWRIYHVAVALNVSNSLLNPIIYALRIPEFRRVLSSFCFTRQAPTNRIDQKRRDNEVSPMTSANHLKTFGTNSPHLKLATGVKDTIL